MIECGSNHHGMSAQPVNVRGQRTSRLRSGLVCPVWVDEGATIRQRLAVPDRRIPSMFRRSALTAAASLAVVLLAVTGCKVQVSAADPGGASTADGASTAGAVQAGTSGVTRAGSLIVEPGAGFSPVYSLISGARRTIDVTMYEFSDTTAEHDLAAAAKRGVQVRVILDHRARSVNSHAYSYFRSHRV